jgi:hypothetical protein
MMRNDSDEGNPGRSVDRGSDDKEREYSYRFFENGPVLLPPRETSGIVPLRGWKLSPWKS